MMELFDEYTGVTYTVPPEQEFVVLQLQARHATVPEIVDALSLPTPAAEPETAHGYLPATDGTVIPVEEVPELHDNALD